MSGIAKSGWGRRVLIAVALLLPVVASVSIVLVFIGSGRRVDLERVASTSLKTLSSAEADFRANDRDWNHVNDFWTGDVKSLYTLTSAAVRGAVAGNPEDPAVKLIDFSVAAADADGSLIPAGEENLPLKVFGPSCAKSGYWYAALLTDLSLAGTTEADYKVDTAGTPSMGKCHNPSRYGFIAFPDAPAGSNPLFFVNENNTVFRYRPDQPVKMRLGSAVPPGLENVDRTYLHWPVDETMWGPPKPRKDHP